MSMHSTNPNPDEKRHSAHESRGTGESLQELVERLGPLPWELVRWFSLRITEILKPIHASGATHGRIFPREIKLSRPWPDQEVVLGENSSAPGIINDDFRALGETMKWLLSAGKSGGKSIIESTPDAEKIISALADGRISDVHTLEAALLDSLPDKNEVANISQAPISIRGTGSGNIADTSRRLAQWKISIAAVVAVIIGLGSYFILKSGSKNTAIRDKERQQSEAKADESPISSETKDKITAKEQLAKDAAAKEQMAKELAEKEFAEKLEANKEIAEREQAAMKIAQEKAIKERAMQIDAMILTSEKVLEDSNSSFQEKEEAFSDVLSLAEHGNVKAIELCGASYWQGLGVEKDREIARTWFEKGASLGNARSMLGLGYCYDQAIGGSHDINKAVEWWTKAAKLGYEVAMSRLGDHYYLNPEAKNVRKAIQWWQKAAEAESPSADAMTNLGIIYAKGIETGKDLSKAISLWEKASEMGAPEAMAELGILYFNGDIEGKEADAFPLFLKAAEAGSIRGMYGLEACYRKGIGTQENKKEADRWASMAADRVKELGQ